MQAAASSVRKVGSLSGASGINLFDNLIILIGEDEEIAV